VSGGAPQSLANHARIVPLYHVVLFGILAVNVIGTAYLAIRAFSFASAWSVVMALAFLGLFFYMRIFALTVQDRVIRLEMRLRLERVLPGDLRPRIPELSVGQLVALRFASDAELPTLVRDVLQQGLRDRREIKKRIRDWQPDHLRA
jgi:hypothetical protein